MRQSLSRRKPPAVLELRARQMRSWLSPPESLVWSALSAGKLGVQFRRQVPLAGRYIGDFVAPKQRVVIEVDGGHHRVRVRADASRDRKLRRLGYRVVRLESELVLRDLEAALAQVRAALEQPP